MIENWKNVVGCEGYEVSDCGRVRSLNRMVDSCKDFKRFAPGKVLSARVNSNCYLQVELSGKKQLISRLVAIAFVHNPDPANKINVNHINGIKADNSMANLEWCTQSENMQHATITGLSSRVRAVEQFTIAGKFIADYPSLAAAMRVTGVDNGIISNYLNGKSSSGGGYHWQNLTGIVNSIGKPISTNHYFN